MWGCSRCPSLWPQATETSGQPAWGRPACRSFLSLTSSTSAPPQRSGSGRPGGPPTYTSHSGPAHQRVPGQRKPSSHCLHTSKTVGLRDPHLPTMSHWLGGREAEVISWWDRPRASLTRTLPPGVTAHGGSRHLRTGRGRRGAPRTKEVRACPAPSRAHSPFPARGRGSAWSEEVLSSPQSPPQPPPG